MKQNIFEKCIICNSNIDIKTSPEHVIPDYLGGRLKLTLLCNLCNSGVGARLYSKLKFDFFIRKASYILRKELPKINKSIENGQRYKTTSPLGIVLKAHSNNSGIKIVPEKKGGSIILPTNNAVRYFERRLIEEGESVDKAKSKAEMIKETPNNKLEQITKKYKIIRWDAKDFQLDYTSNVVEIDNALLLMSFEYLAVILGKSIYDPFFDNLRNALLNGTKPSNVKVELFTSPKPQPFHLIFPEFEKDRTMVNIHIFEYMLARIEFVGLHVDTRMGIDFCYLEDLVKRNSFGALSVVEGKSNKWRQFNF